MLVEAILVVVPLKVTARRIARIAHYRLMLVVVVRMVVVLPRVIHFRGVPLLVHGPGLRQVVGIGE